jgi:hypothetical protein
MSMFSTVQQWGIRVFFAAGLFMFCLPAAQAQVQGRLQTRQNAPCQQSVGQARLTARQQPNALRAILRNQLQQLNALQQSAQLTSAQLQAISQLQSAYQTALLQMAALRNDTLTAAQVQTILALQLRAVPLPDGP